MLITPRKVHFSKDVMTRLWSYVDKQIEYLTDQSATFRDSTMPEWTRLLKGKPKNETKDFPFPNASNLVVQLIGTRVEQMLSRAMIIYGIDPLWSMGALGDLPGQESDEQARLLEQFMSDMAIDPQELNLYRKEEIMFHNGIAYGTAFMGFPWQYITEERATDISGHTVGLNRTSEFSTLVIKDGPNPENISVRDILIDNSVTDLEKARFIAKRVRLKREAVEDRAAFGVWSSDDVEKILRSPDMKGSNYESANDNPTGNEYDADYLIHECYFKFTHDRKTFSIIAHYHKATRTKLSCVFNYFPNNTLPLEDLRFGYDDDSYRGYGFIEMLQGYQAEVSQLHNNRLDNEAIRNNVTFRIDPASELANNLKFYPGVGIPAVEGEVEVLNTNNGSIDNGQSESMATSMANERAGIDPAISGNGSGIVNNKRGIYSSQGTMAVLQQQNNRTGLRMMDIRGTHVKIGRKLLDLYANLGIGKRLARYGQQSEILRKALDNVAKGNLGLILKASNASTNIEADRQNSILLQGLQDKYIGTVTQILQQINQAQNDEGQKKFLMDVLYAEQTLCRHIFRIFGHFDVDKMLPFPESIKNVRQQEQQSGGNISGQPQIIPFSNAQPGNFVPTGSSGR
jgi:hypothetical protein